MQLNKSLASCYLPLNIFNILSKGVIAMVCEFPVCKCFNNELYKVGICTEGLAEALVRPNIGHFASVQFGRSSGRINNKKCSLN